MQAGSALRAGLRASSRQAGLENLQGGRLHSLSGPLLQSVIEGEEVFPYLV